MFKITQYNIICCYFTAIASFTPHEQGDFVISVYRGEKHIKNSPFKVHVGDKEMGHAGKVTIQGATTKAVANRSNELTIDTTGAGSFIYNTFSRYSVPVWSSV